MADTRVIPRIVCLCGSTQFHGVFQKANFEETMKGNIVLSVGFYPHSQGLAHGQETGVTPKQKDALDELHKRKIDVADEILVLNVDGYVGSSTASEIRYAIARGKPVRWLEPSKIPNMPELGQERRPPPGAPIWKVRLTTKMEVEAVASTPQEAAAAVRRQHPGLEITAVCDFWTQEEREFDG